MKHLKTFNEKLQWLKLYDRNSLYITLFDKVEAKKYVADIIGEEHIIPTLGVWDNSDEIDFNKLPDQLVLKCNHDSGEVFTCRDKEHFDKEYARKGLKNYWRRISTWLGENGRIKTLREKCWRKIIWLMSQERN